MEERRRKVAALYLARLTQEEIARQLGMSQQCVSKDCQAIRKQYRIDRDALIDRDMAELDELEKQCALQFNATKAREWISERRMLKERRSKLIGLDAPVKVANTDPTGTRPGTIIVKWDEQDADYPPETS